MKIFCLIGIFFVGLSVYAVRPQVKNWYKGELMMADHQVVKVDINYDAATDLLQVRDENTVKIYSARQVTSFGYFDAAHNTIRRFVSLVQPDKRNRFRRSFFEIVLTGEMYLLRRLRYTTSPATMQAALTEMESPWYDTKNRYEYFVYTDDRFIPMNQFRKAIFPRMMRMHEKELEAFMEERRLSIFTQQGQFMLINRYNVLQNPNKIALF